MKKFKKTGINKIILALLCIIVLLSGMLVRSNNTIKELDNDIEKFNDEIENLKYYNNKKNNDILNSTNIIKAKDEKIFYLQTELANFKLEKELEENIVDEVIQAIPKYRSLGTFQITYYCKEDYPHICNDGNSKVTATGTISTSNRTIAVDPSVIPLGSTVKINGQEYIAEDTGGAIKGHKIDILVETHNKALENGISSYEVFIKE